MDFIQGVRYNLRGLRVGLTSGKLFFWGMIRFALVVLITVALAGIILSYQAELTELLWVKPASPWTAWLWHALSWLVTLLLIAFSAILSFVISQILFSAVIMDHMSKIIELKVTGTVVQRESSSLFRALLHVVKQEIPRMMIPLFLSFLLLAAGWVTPFGPLLTLASALISILFLSWDNTDLVPARRLITFKRRFNHLTSALSFHVGFGLPFLVPGLNLLFLSFAPVGATLYYLDRYGLRNDNAERKG